MLLALTLLGSDRLLWFDAALIGYLFGLIFAAFGIAYRYSVWLKRPPTAMLNRRGWDAFRAGRFRNLAALPALVFTQLLAQGFIRHRSRSRWIAHQLLFWGCILAAVVTIPLTLGLLHFQSVGQDAERYQVYLSQLGTISFDAGSIIGWVVFHALDISAFLVLAGVFIFLRRRLRDPGALAVERAGDFLALAGLFAVSVTGLFLTVSSTWLEGQYYAALNTLHALTVILGLMYIPFGKLFHIFQRPANLGVQYYKRANLHGEQAACRLCGEPFAAARHIDDLKEVLGQLGFDYGLASSGGAGAGGVAGGVAGGQPVGQKAGSYQDTCPACRRRQVALAQSARVGGFG